MKDSYIALKMPNYDISDLKEMKRISIEIMKKLDKEDMRISILALSECLQMILEEYEEQRNNK